MKATKLRTRKLINKLARRWRHREARRAKWLRLNAVVIPFGIEGWDLNEDDCYVDGGGQLLRLSMKVYTTACYKKSMFEGESLAELRRCARAMQRRPTRDAVVSRWPKEMVKLNWSGDLVPWKSVENRVVKY